MGGLVRSVSTFCLHSDRKGTDLKPLYGMLEEKVTFTLYDLFSLRAKQQANDTSIPFIRGKEIRIRNSETEPYKTKLYLILQNSEGFNGICPVFKNPLSKCLTLLIL